MRSAALLAVLFVGLASVSLAVEVAKPSEKSGLAPAAPKFTHSAEDDYELYQIFVDALDQVERNYVTKVDRRELIGQQYRLSFAQQRLQVFIVEHALRC